MAVEKGKGEFRVEEKDLLRAAEVIKKKRSK